MLRNISDPGLTNGPSYPISEEIFDAFDAQYFKITIGECQLTYNELGELISRYARFLEL